MILSKRFFWICYFFVLINWFAYTFFEYFTCGFRTFDTGLQIRPIVELAMFGTYTNSFLEISHPFQNHFRPILVLFYPLVSLFPSAIWLKLAKCVSLAICPLLLYRFSKRLNLGKFSTVIPLFWMINDVLANTLYAENHNTFLSLPFIILAFYFATFKRYKLLIACLLLLPLFKENLPLIWISVGLFLVVEIKEFRKGVAICVLGIALTFLLNFVFIPFFIQGLSIHATSSINPFAHIDLKLIMLFKALLSVGFFLLFRPQTLLYVFPSYGAYLIGGKTEFFWLLYHYHDFTTTILHIAGLFVIKQLIQTPQSTWVRYYFKIIACLLFLVGFLKLPLFKMLEKAESIYELYETRIELLDLKPLIPQDHNVFSTEGLSEYLLSYKYARSLDNNSLTRHQDIFYKNSSIIFPKNQKFSQLSKSRYISVLTDLTEKSKLGICLHYDNYTYLHYFRCN